MDNTSRPGYHRKTHMNTTQGLGGAEKHKFCIIIIYNVILHCITVLFKSQPEMKELI